MDEVENMAIDIGPETADSELLTLATRLSALTGETVTEAVKSALREKLTRENQSDGPLKPKEASERLRRLIDLSNEAAKWPLRDHRTPEEILGYDENGLPT